MSSSLSYLNAFLSECFALMMLTFNGDDTYHLTHGKPCPLIMNLHGPTRCINT